MVAAVHGYTGGFGLHLALTCDLVVAAESAVFAEPFTDRGFNADSGGSWLLPRFVGLTRAKRLIYTGERIDAVIGARLADRRGRRRRRARSGRRRAGRGRSPRAPHRRLPVASKKLLHDNLRTTIDDALHVESMAIELTTRSDDFAEGMRAFVEKRPPRFTGR